MGLVATYVILSMVMVGRVGHLLDELLARYTPANAHLTRIDAVSIERALALRRMVIAKMQDPYRRDWISSPEAALRCQGRRSQSGEAPQHHAETHQRDHKRHQYSVGQCSILGRIDSRIDSLTRGIRRHLKAGVRRSCFRSLTLERAQLRSGALAQTDALRDELDEKIAAIRNEMYQRELKVPSQRSGPEAQTQGRLDLGDRDAPCSGH